MGGVFHQQQVELLADCPDLVHLARVSPVVHHDDRTGTVGHGRADQRRVDIHRVGLDIHEYWSCAGMLDDRHGRRKCHGRCDHLVPRTDPRHFQGRMQPGGTGAQRKCSRRLQIGGERLLEALGLGSGRDPARTQAVNDLGDFFLADKGGGEG